MRENKADVQSEIETDLRRGCGIIFDRSGNTMLRGWCTYEVQELSPASAINITMNVTHAYHD
jgi:hypothetical protein